MEAEQVIEKILADANSEAEKVKKQADEKQASEQARLGAELNDYKKQTEVIAEKNGNDTKTHLLAAARMDIAKEYLAEKRLIFDEVFAQAKSQFESLPDEDYRDVCVRLMAKATQTGDEEVVVDTNEKRIDQKLINQVNKQLNSKSQGKLTLSEERQNLGAGFILKRGKIKNNVSLSVLLVQARETLEIELAKELFAD